MKFVVQLLAALLATSSAQLVESTFKQTCLYCKFVDTNAGFLYSYGFCPDDQVLEKEERCLSDYWNYISSNLKCLQDIKPGWALDIFDDCGATHNPSACVNITSTPDMAGTEVESTYILRDGQYCTMKIDATESVARVTFSDTTQLGVFYPGYQDENLISVPQGQVVMLTIYNGNDQGMIQYTMTFSGAVKLASAAAAAASALALWL
uniref:Uncharacterized protein n=1 Tax=Strombidium inclinatum TaxID=197538 RepID=A0A7S3IZR9_9SPIT|mmetsp:Transcript_9001/g.13768  ORF Transcript_9001/g.13768 Transcript_9001/m.13768 type:complete len:207 (+) Transcript_9001:1-621(+)|eukprot:CAMPEP_0170494544 /NCGR_PEP_ID=MMETSP0208-20121228/14705_1 /TAXON_ID=197538 /ORGANISM="Strombidium inclinatum, Strain S3" /LENGTH=206 /DNA_ID=CAMNT_0010770617 /DNA_START=1 /DNA_END=621 /DNA_ORIENTATION=-